MQGFADGMMFPNLTVYIAEISSTELRGSLCNVVNICQCLGLCLTFSLSLLVPWRTLAWLLTAPVLLSLLGLREDFERNKKNNLKSFIHGLLKILHFIRHGSVSIFSPCQQLTDRFTHSLTH